MVPCLTFDGNRSYYGALSTDSASAVALMDFWGGRCPLTGITHPRLLRASHMKPWSACTDAAERLNVHNGLLLAAHLDAAFDAGLITFGRLLGKVGGSCPSSVCGVNADDCAIDD